MLGTFNYSNAIALSLLFLQATLQLCIALSGCGLLCPLLHPQPPHAAAASPLLLHVSGSRNRSTKNLKNLCQVLRVCTSVVSPVLSIGANWIWDEDSQLGKRIPGFFLVTLPLPLSICSLEDKPFYCLNTDKNPSE